MRDIIRVGWRAWAPYHNRSTFWLVVVESPILSIGGHLTEAAYFNEKKRAMKLVRRLGNDGYPVSLARWGRRKGRYFRVIWDFTPKEAREV